MTQRSDAGEAKTRNPSIPRQAVFNWATELPCGIVVYPGLEVIKLEFILRLKIKRNDWLFADTCPQAANRCALFWVWACTQVL